jgi:hypothetical protein
MIIENDDGKARSSRWDLAPCSPRRDPPASGAVYRFLARRDLGAGKRPSSPIAAPGTDGHPSRQQPLSRELLDVRSRKRTLLRLVPSSVVRGGDRGRPRGGSAGAGRSRGKAGARDASRRPQFSPRVLFVGSAGVLPRRRFGARRDRLSRPFREGQGSSFLHRLRARFRSRHPRSSELPHRPRRCRRLRPRSRRARPDAFRDARRPPRGAGGSAHRARRARPSLSPHRRRSP